MNIRQQRYKQNRIEFRMSQYDAAIAAGYSHNTASRMSKDLEKLVNIEGYLNQVGLTDYAIAQKLRQKTEATKPISCNVFIDKEGNLKQNNAGGKTMDFIEVDDNSTQMDALKTICQIKGHMKSKVEHSGSIKTGETKIYITNSKGADAGLPGNTTRIPREICI